MSGVDVSMYNCDSSALKNLPLDSDFSKTSDLHNNLKKEVLEEIELEVKKDLACQKIRASRRTQRRSRASRRTQRRSRASRRTQRRRRQRGGAGYFRYFSR